ncbi:MAG: hypothetical protein ACKOGA_22380 [Planctomycetaceae bacterium]
MNAVYHARFGLLACLWLWAPGCREVPLKNDPDAVTAPSFGLNSVPRQWEPELEEGDTTVRGGAKIAAEFADQDEEKSSPEAETATAASLLEEEAGEVSKPETKPLNKGSAKSATKRTPAKSGGPKEAQTLPVIDKAAQKQLDDDFGPG